MKAIDTIQRPPTNVELIKKMNETIVSVNTTCSQDDLAALEATELEIDSIFTGG
jgi:hypothetical protein